LVAAGLWGGCWAGGGFGVLLVVGGGAFPLALIIYSFRCLFRPVRTSKFLGFVQAFPTSFPFPESFSEAAPHNKVRIGPPPLLLSPLSAEFVSPSVRAPVVAPFPPSGELH